MRPPAQSLSVLPFVFFHADRCQRLSPENNGSQEKNMKRILAKQMTMNACKRHLAFIGIGGYSGKPGLTGAVAEVSACTG